MAVIDVTLQEPKIVLIEVGFRGAAGPGLSEAQVQAMIDRAIAEAIGEGGAPIIATISAATLITSNTRIQGAV